MRRCSRCSEADSSRCFSGCGAAGASDRVGSFALEQPARATHSARLATHQRENGPARSRTLAVRALLMTALRNLNLLGVRRLDPRAAALLDRAPDPNTLA